MNRCISPLVRACLAVFCLLAVSHPAEARFRVHFIPHISHRSATSEPQASPSSDSAFKQASMDSAERERKIELIREGKLVERHAGESDAAYEKRKDDLIAIYRNQDSAEKAAIMSAPAKAKSAGSGATGLMFLPLLALLFFARKLIGPILALAGSGSGKRSEDEESFDSRVSQRLAEMNDGGSGGDDSPAFSVNGQGFGRRAA